MKRFFGHTSHFMEDNSIRAIILMLTDYDLCKTTTYKNMGVFLQEFWKPSDIILDLSAIN